MAGAEPVNRWDGFAGWARGGRELDGTAQALWSTEELAAESFMTSSGRLAGRAFHAASVESTYASLVLSPMNRHSQQALQISSRHSTAAIEIGRRGGDDRNGADDSCEKEGQRSGGKDLNRSSYMHGALTLLQVDDDGDSQSTIDVKATTGRSSACAGRFAPWAAGVVRPYGCHGRIGS